jgi:hypothetical protein
LSQLEFRFSIGRFRNHDPKGLVLQHASQVSSYWPYTHDKFEDEIFIECTQDWEEVVQRMSNLNMTRFKAMIMDEQVDTIEKLDQDTLKVWEEIRAIETTEEQIRGFLFLEGEHIIIDQLHNDPCRDVEDSC